MQKVIEVIENNYKKILIPSTILASLAIILSYMLKTSLGILSIIGVIGAIISYSAARYDMSEEEIEKNFKYVSISMITGIFGIIHQMMYSGIYKRVMGLVEKNDLYSKMYIGLANSTFVISIIANTIIIFVLVIYMRDEIRKEKIMKLKCMSLKKIQDKEEEVSDENPDIVLCRNAETGEKVIWPHSDR